jgi:glyoxylase-like metal-dependent hydrolase (beta-lactamase superfamily II)
VLHTGDLFIIPTWLIDYAGGGSLLEWPKTLDAVLNDKTLDFDTVIPGHGPVQKRADLVAYQKRVASMVSRVQGLIRAGKSQDDVSAVLAAEFAWPVKSIYQQWGLPGMMAELK